MARTTKTTTSTAKKAVAKTVEPKVTEEVKAPVVEEAKVEEVKEEKKVKEAKKFAPTDLIDCVSMFPGQCIMIGAKSGIVYTWFNMGDVEQVEYQDVMAEILNKASSYIYSPLIVVQDQDFVEQRHDLEDFYKNLYTPEELKDILMHESADRVGVLVKSMPRGAQEAVKNLASTLIDDGKLDSVRTIKVLDEIFGTELLLQAQLLEG